MPNSNAAGRKPVNWNRRKRGKGKQKLSSTDTSAEATRKSKSSMLSKENAHSILPSVATDGHEAGSHEDPPEAPLSPLSFIQSKASQVVSNVGTIFGYIKSMVTGGFGGSAQLLKACYTTIAGWILGDGPEREIFEATMEEIASMITLSIKENFYIFRLSVTEMMLVLTETVLKSFRILRESFLPFGQIFLLQTTVSRNYTIFGIDRDRAAFVFFISMILEIVWYIQASTKSAEPWSWYTSIAFPVFSFSGLLSGILLALVTPTQNMEPVIELCHIAMFCTSATAWARYTRKNQVICALLVLTSVIFLIVVDEMCLSKKDCSMDTHLEIVYSFPIALTISFASFTATTIMLVILGQKGESPGILLSCVQTVGLVGAWWVAMMRLVPSIAEHSILDEHVETIVLSYISGTLACAISNQEFGIRDMGKSTTPSHESPAMQDSESKQEVDEGQTRPEGSFPDGGAVEPFIPPALGGNPQEYREETTHRSFATNSEFSINMSGDEAENRSKSQQSPEHILDEMKNFKL